MSMEAINGWASIRLKYLATINDEALPETTDSNLEISYIDIGNVSATTGVESTTQFLFADAPSRARRIVRNGDVIISTVRTYLQAIAPIENATENLIVSTGFAVIRPIPKKLDAGFCKYSLRDFSFLAEVEQRSVGVSYPAINASELGDIFIKVPSLASQRKISLLLDRETAHIDQLIQAKENLLAMLAEKRQALITQAVTRGLDPSVALKPSGVDWLGDVPEHWEVKRAKWLFKERDVRTQTGEEILLSLRMEKGLVPHEDVSEKPIRNDELIGYKTTHKNDLVINKMRASSGLVSVTPFLGLVSPDYSVFEATEHVSPDYYMELFKTNIFKAIFRSVSKGLGTGSSGFLRMYTENFYTISMPHPPLAEQLKIIDYIEREKTRLNAIHSATEQTITLLKERRSALITAAVTGQIQIPLEA